MKKIIVLMLLIVPVWCFAQDKAGQAPASAGGVPSIEKKSTGIPPLPEEKSGGIPPVPDKPAVVNVPKGKKVKLGKLPAILVCTCANGEYAAESDAPMYCQPEAKDPVRKIRLDQLYSQGYRLIQVVNAKDKTLYYFDKR